MAFYAAPEAPVFVRKLESLDVFESTPVKLECDVKGFPQPEITWYQVGTDFPTTILYASRLLYH